MNVNFTVPDYLLPWAIVILAVIAYSIVAAIVGAICERRGWDGGGPCPPWEIAAIGWPITIAAVTVTCAAIVLWWTLFLPARLVYRAMKR